MKKIAKWIFIVFIMGLFLAPSSFANCKMHGGGHGKGSGCSGGGCHGKKSPCPIMNYTLYQAHEMLEHRKSLGLNEDQIKTIKSIKLELAKRMIQQQAGMQVMMLDMKSKMKEEPVDVEAMKAMIDQGSSSMAQGAKQTLDDYVKLRSVLTAEQAEKMKSVH